MDENSTTDNFPTLSQLGLGTDLMYQRPRGNAYIEQLKKIFFDEIYQKDLSNSDLQRLNQKVQKISD